LFVAFFFCEGEIISRKLGLCVQNGRTNSFLLFPHKKQTKNKNKQKLVVDYIDENNNGVHLWHTRWKSRIKNILFLFFFFFFSQTIPAFIFGALSRRARQQQQQHL